MHDGSQLQTSRPRMLSTLAREHSANETAMRDLHCASGRSFQPLLSTCKPPTREDRERQHSRRELLLGALVSVAALQASTAEVRTLVFEAPSPLAPHQMASARCSSGGASFSGCTSVWSCWRMNRHLRHLLPGAAPSTAALHIVH
jgi:hypothetical protein